MESGSDHTFFPQCGFLDPLKKDVRIGQLLSKEFTISGRFGGMSNPPKLSIDQVYVYLPPEKCYDNACDVPLKSAPPKIVNLR